LGNSSGKFLPFHSHFNSQALRFRWIGFKGVFNLGLPFQILVNSWFQGPKGYWGFNLGVKLPRLGLSLSRKGPFFGLGHAGITDFFPKFPFGTLEGFIHPENSLPILPFWSQSFGQGRFKGLLLASIPSSNSRFEP